MHAQGNPDPRLQAELKKLLDENKIFSVRSLSSAFSAKTEEALISYTQSQSLVEFLIQNYGKDKILHLLNIFKEGSTTDDALMEVYGFDQDGLDNLWRESLAPAKPKVQLERKDMQTVFNLMLTNPAYICSAYS
jgi:hypothetical protein